MKKSLKQYAAVLSLFIFMAPVLVNAAWWNPLSWFNYWSFAKPSENEQTKALEDRIKELEDKLEKNNSNDEENRTSTSADSINEETVVKVNTPQVLPQTITNPVVNTTPVQNTQTSQQPIPPAIDWAKYEAYKSDSQNTNNTLVAALDEVENTSYLNSVEDELVAANDLSAHYSNSAVMESLITDGLGKIREAKSLASDLEYRYNQIIELNNQVIWAVSQKNISNIESNYNEATEKLKNAAAKAEEFHRVKAEVKTIYNQLKDLFDL